MPTPISISSSPISNSGHAHRAGHRVHLVAQAHQFVDVRACLGRRADHLDDEEVAGHAAPPDGVGRVGDRDVVVDQQGLDLHTLGLGHLLAHVEGHPVARVVVHDVQHALRRREELAGLQHEVHRRCGEHVTGTGRVEHAPAHDHHVGRFVAGPGALHDRHLVLVGRVGPHDEVVLGDVAQGVRVGQGDALEHLGDELAGVVDELLHGWLRSG
jgi:hypothetical protein